MEPSGLARTVNIGAARRSATNAISSTAQSLDASPPLKQRLSSGGALLDMPSFVSAVLYGPLNLQALPGSGAAQAPQVARLLCAAGLRAIDQSGPPGVAIFTDSHTTEALAAMAPEVALVWLMSGLAAEQAECEAHYAAELRRPLLVACLLDRLAQIRDACPHAVDAAALAVALAPLTAPSAAAGAGAPPPPRARADDEPPPKAARTQEAAAPAPAAWAASDEELEARVAAVVKSAAPLLGASELQLEREWQALLSSRATLANACLARFLGATRVHVQEATLLPSKAAHRVRVVLTLFDSVEHADQQLPRRFAWMPSLLAVLRVHHADDLTRQMLARLWRELHTQGFWPSASLRAAVEPGLTEWIASCLRHRSAAGVPLRAAVRPQTPLCLYLHGEAGSGKSSFVRALLPALAATLRAHLDPELAAHAVKQTLNKPLDALQLEFERRPNNNDLSIVNVVSMAREPLSGAADRPKLLLLGLEEMPPGGGGARRGAALQLRLSAARNLLPQDGRLLHPDAAPLLAALAPPPPSPPPSASPPASLLNGLGPAAGGATAVMAELRHVLDLWLCGALAPAVLVCTCREHAEQLWRGLEARLGGRAALIRGVDPLEVKMNRALYDRRDERSLRDELLDAREQHAHAAVELLAPDAQAQLLIREMVEDSPSVVAHSVHRRILTKAGLLFVVRVERDAPAAAGAGGASPQPVLISPELASRASLIW